MTNSICSVLIWYMGMKNARKCNNDVRAYTPRSSTTRPRGTMGNRAQRQDEFRPVAPAWLGNESAQKFDAKTALFCLIFQSRKPDKGEVRGSSPPQPTIQITRKYAAILTLPLSGDLHQKTVLSTICQLYDWPNRTTLRTLRPFG